MVIVRILHIVWYISRFVSYGFGSQTQTHSVDSVLRVDFATPTAGIRWYIRLT